MLTLPTALVVSPALVPARYFRTVQPVMVEEEPSTPPVQAVVNSGLTAAHEFRHGSGGAVSKPGGAVIGFQGGIGHGMGQDEELPVASISMLSAEDQFRYGSGRRGGSGGAGAVIGFQGGTGRGMGVGKELSAGVSSSQLSGQDEFRYGPGRAGRAFRSKFVGFEGNGASGLVEETPPAVVDEIEDATGNVVSTASVETPEVEEVATAA